MALTRFGSRFSLSGLFGQRSDPPPMTTVGDIGTQILGGYIVEAERNPNLRSSQKYVTYSDMLANTTIVAAGARYYLNLISKAGWTVLPSDPNDRVADEAAQFVQESFADLRRPWHRVIRRAAGYRLLGFSIQEMTAKRLPDGRIGMLDVMPRPQATVERWDLAADGEILGVTQRSPNDGDEIYLPRSKIVYLVDDALNDSPEGLGVLRHIVETNDRLVRYQELEGMSFETDIRGIPIARAPLADLQTRVNRGDITEAQRDRLLSALRDFLRKHVKNTRLGMLLDSRPWFGEGDGTKAASPIRQFDLELLRGDGTGAEPVNTAIDRLNREMARLLGVEFLLLGSSGSQALSRDKSQNFGLMVESALDELRESFENDYLRFLMDLNGVPDDKWPTLKTETVQYRDVETIVEGLERLARAGLHPEDPAVNEVRELLGLSAQPETLVNSLLEEARQSMDPEDENPDDEEGKDDGASVSE